MEIQKTVWKNAWIFCWLSGTSTTKFFPLCVQFTVKQCLEILFSKKKKSISFMDFFSWWKGKIYLFLVLFKIFCILLETMYNASCPHVNIPLIRTSARPLDLLKVYLNMFHFERTDKPLQTNLWHDDVQKRRYSEGSSCLFEKSVDTHLSCSNSAQWRLAKSHADTIRLMIKGFRSYLSSTSFFSSTFVC